MSAAEKLKALQTALDARPQTKDAITAALNMRIALPQIVAVVEAAQQMHSKGLIPTNGDLWGLEAALSALDEALGDVT